MKKKTLSIFIMGLIILLLQTNNIRAQFIEDAIRLSQSNAPFSPRTSALGFSYYGISDDATAMIFNPAGLSLVRGYEVGIGINLTSTNTKTDYLENSKKYSKDEFYFSNIQVTFPMEIPIKNNKALKYTLSIGYFLENDFDAHYRFSGFNKKNTFIAQQNSIKAPWLYETWITDENYNTTINKDLQQDGRIAEEGGLHNMVFGIGIDITENLSLGATIMAKAGSYDYYRSFIESDINNIYNTFEVDDINNIKVIDKLSQDIAGITGILGLQVRINDNIRIGASIKLPTYNYIEESYSSEYKVEYDSNSKAGIQTFTSQISGIGDYNVSTPFEFSLGASGNFLGMTFSLAASYKNATNLSFYYNINDYSIESANYFDALNEDIQNNLTGVFTLGAGIEYKLPEIPLYLRASYTTITSPYDNDIEGTNHKIIGTGIGIVCAKNLIIDAAFRFDYYKIQQAVYGTQNVPNLYSYYFINYSPINYGLGIRYRF